jgi:phosphoribosylanthranilate isomerase
MFVKICGITRLEDARAAVECGANALGFVFWPNSPRWIDPAQARSIIEVLPPFVTPVGLFVNQPVDEVNEAAAIARLGAVQLQGDEGVEYAAKIRSPIVKAMSAEAASDATALNRWSDATMILLDAHDPVRRGGTGQTIDWALAGRVAARRRVMLAGGLSPLNVAEAIESVRPFGVDVASGVESAPGIKDHKRMLAFFEAIHDPSHDAARS